MAGADGALPSDHGVIFVPLAVPGDHVRVTGLKRRGKVVRAEIEQVLEASPHRREPPCQVVHACGGCPWMPMSDEHQATLKRQRVAALGVDVQWHQASTLGYRQRARLAWHAASQPSLGYRARRTNRVVDVPECVALDEARQTAWTRLRTLADTLAGQGEIHLGPCDQGAVALLRTTSAQRGDLYRRCAAALDDALRGVVLDVDGARASWGETNEAYRVDGARLVSPVGGFAQGHGALNEALVQYVGEQVGADKRVLELYCGAGNLSVRLAREATSWTGVELNADAVQACRTNLSTRGLAGKVVEASAEAFPSGSFDVVVLDPPRAGAKEAVARMASTRATRVVYVSCHLATLQRDLKTLAEQGYVLKSCAAFDMFPQTPHVEVVASFSLTSARLRSERQRRGFERVDS